MKKKLSIILIGLLVIIAAIAVIYLLVFFKKKNIVKEKVKIVDYDRSDHVGAPNEETVLKEYGLSKEQAIQIIKSKYNANGYKFTAKVNYESHYIIKVTHPDLEEVTYWDIEPNSREARLLNNNEK
jgi:hypothetical protein